MISKNDITEARKALNNLPMCAEYIILRSFVNKVEQTVAVDKKIPALLRDYHGQS